MDNRLTRFAGVVIWLLCAASHSTACAGELMAGAAKVDITDPAAPSRNPLFAKALVLNDGTNSVVLITVDAVAIAELGRIKNDFLTNLRARLQSELEIPPASVLVNASHCHGVVCPDVEQRAFEAVKTAWGNLQPVRVGTGVGQENQIMENRRLRLRNGNETDVRHAYSMPPDEEVVGVGPVDPEIGLLRLDRPDGQTMAVVYNFACHPILGVPSGENTADFPVSLPKRSSRTVDRERSPCSCRGVLETSTRSATRTCAIPATPRCWAIDWR